MNNIKGRVVISIDNLDGKTKQIDYSIVELFSESPFKLVLKNKYVPVAGQRLFIYPDSNIPRFKLKDFCEKHKVSVAKSKDTADVLFIHPETANKEDLYYSTDRYYTKLVYRETFIDYLKRATRVGDPKYIKIINDLANNKESIILLRDYYSFESQGIGKHTLPIIEPGDVDDNDNPLIPNCKKRPDYIFTVNDKQRKMLDFVQSKDFYHSDALLALLNEDGATMNEEMYKGIINLFNSSDVNDHKVAMEAMANCDYQKSAVYLLTIFYHHQDDIYNCDNKNHVNFKSFLKFFNLKAGNSIDIDDMIERLRAKKLLTSTNLKRVMELSRSLITDSVEGVTKSFVSTGIAPIDELQQEATETDASQPVQSPVPDPMAEPQITDL